jgi:hypothetical protein
VDDVAAREFASNGKHPLPAPRCICAQPVIVEDMYGDERCAHCGRLPRHEPS